MWIKEPGNITDRIAFLGTYQICLYLLKGKEAMIIGGGMSCIAPTLERQFLAMDFDLEKIKYLVIPHSHFDHCGAVPYLKRKFPWIQILSSAYSKELFSKEKVVNAIANANRELIGRFGFQAEYERLNLQFNRIQIDQVVTEGDIIDIGDGIEAHFIETQGHSKCSITVYVPKLKAMFPSDAAPCPVGNEGEPAFPSPQYDFSLYMESLQKLAAYEMEICAFDHHGVFTGERAGKGLQQGLEQTEKFRNYITEQYKQIGDLDKTAQKIAIEAIAKNELDFLNPELEITLAKTAIIKILGLAI